MSSANVLTPAIAATLTEWAEAFLGRWFHQPPEFFDIRYLNDYKYLYRQNIFSLLNPVHTDWFPRLVQEATAADLDTLEAALGTDGGKKGYLRFFQYELLGTARQADKEGRPCSAVLPSWFRNKGWGVDRWRCEGDAPEPVVAKQPPAPAPAPEIAVLTATVASLSATPSHAELERIIATLRATADSLEARLAH